MEAFARVMENYSRAKRRQKNHNEALSNIEL
jgi:hypothetical protein